MRTAFSRTPASVAAAACLATLLAGSAAHADSHDPAAAEQLFRDAREAMKQGELDKACASFEESQRLDPAVGTLLNLAECEEGRGRVATAWEHVRRAIDTMPTGDDRAGLASERAVALARRLPKLTVRLAPGDAADARVQRDGIALGTVALGTPLPVDPGAHTVTVLAAGRSARVYAVTLEEAKSLEFMVHAGLPTVAAREPLAKERTRLPGFLGLGVGGAAIATGAITGLLALDRASAMNPYCNAARICQQQGLDIGAQGRSYATISVVSLITGALLVVGGAVWVATR